MTSRVYVTSTEGSTGKSTVSLGMVELLASRGRVGVFRPVARSSRERDFILELLLQHATAEVPYEDCIGTSYEHVHDDPDGALALIVERFAAVEARCDTVVIIGSDYTDVGSPTELGYNARVAANLGAPVVLVLGGVRVDGTGFLTPDELFQIAELSRQELHAGHATLLAIIANRSDPSRLAEIADAVASDGTAQHREAANAPARVPSWAIPESPHLVAPTYRSVVESTGGTLVRGVEASLDVEVLGTVIAAMTLDNTLPRLTEGALVIVPGDRSDVLVGAVLAHHSETFPKLAGLLLSGGFELSPAVARLLDGFDDSLPIGSCQLNTFETAVTVSRTRGRLAAETPRKAELALRLFNENVNGHELLAALDAAPNAVITPLALEQALLGRARRDRKRIVLPEGDDDRILRAAAELLERDCVDLTILGDPDAVRARAAELELDLGAAQLLSPHDPELVERFAAEYTRLRAHKGPAAPTLEQSRSIVQDVSYFGTMMVQLGLADGMVSGAAHTTAHTIRPGFEIVKTKPGVSVVSSVFLMALADRVLVYGDCAVVPNPTAEQLADIAISSAETAAQFGVDPKVAMLSYSTGSSGSGADVEKVRAATALVRERRPDLAVDGPIQYDAAADPTVAAAKMPDSPVAGRATVFIFPDLNTGNNTYKAVQRSASAIAMGPVLQGLGKPINDLSRGALVRDIVNTVAITAIQAQAETQPTETAHAETPSPSTPEDAQ